MLDAFLLNYFSILIPTIIIFLSFVIYLIFFNYRKFKALLWLAHAIFVSAFGLLSFNLAVNIKANLWVFIGYFLFFIVGIFVTKAIFIRFSLKIHTQRVLIITMIGTLALYYFSFIKDSLDARVNVSTLTLACIFFHRLRTFYKTHSQNHLDRLLKIIFIFIPSVTFLLALFTDSPYNHPDHNTGMLTLAWLQFIVILLAMLIFLLISGTTLHESLSRLRIERNTDTLTGILNRRAFLEKLDEIHHLTQEVEHSLILFDIDHFKKINDQHGHQIGDLALQHITKLISYSVRSSDVFARIGGEEFIIFLPNLAQDRALTVAERFRNLIDSSPLLLTHDQKLHITASFGVTTFNHQHTLKDALKEVDILLYRAKTLGRNNIQSNLQKTKF